MRFLLSKELGSSYSCRKKRERVRERYKSELVTFYYCKIECECANTTDIDFSLDYSETHLPVCRFGRTTYIVSYFSLDFIVSVIVVLIEIRTQSSKIYHPQISWTHCRGCLWPYRRWLKKW